MTSSLNPLMLSLGSDNVIKIWDLKKMRAVHELPAGMPPASAGGGGGGGPSPSVASLSKAVWTGQSFVVASASGMIRIYENSPFQSPSSSTLPPAMSSSGSATSLLGDGKLPPLFIIPFFNFFLSFYLFLFPFFRSLVMMTLAASFQAPPGAATSTSGVVESCCLIHKAAQTSSAPISLSPAPPSPAKYFVGARDEWII